MKLTFVQVEMDEGDAGEAIRGLGTIFQDGRATMIAAPGPAVAALPEPEPKAEPEPKPKRKQSRRQATDGKPRTINGAMREAIAERPRTNEEILDYMLARGFETDSKKVTANLCYLRARNEIYKDDRDKTWRMADKS